jgi:hypothetical protein
MGYKKIPYFSKNNNLKMSCNLTSGISKGCRDNAGGIVEVLLGNFPSGYTGNEWYNVTGGTVDSISGVSLYAFVPNKNSSSWSEEIQSTIENGSIGYAVSVNMVFAKNDADKRNAIKVLGEANLIAIVRDKNEKYWLLGPQSGLELSAGTGQSGVMLNDLNGWNITISGTEPQPAYEVSASIISGLMAS